MSTITLSAGRKFVNRKGTVITIARALPVDDQRHIQGFRFEDASGIVYTETGNYAVSHTDAAAPEHKFDLVSVYDPEVHIDRTVEDTITEEKVLGLLGRLGDRVDTMFSAMRRNPGKTALGVTAAGGAGYAGYRYYEYGTVFPVNDSVVDDVKQVASAVASIFDKFR